MECKYRANSEMPKWRIDSYFSVVAKVHCRRLCLIV
jgi:hypothetical protein